MQPRQQRPGVDDVAAHRRVGPLAVAVAVEAQVQEHQPRHVLDELLAVAQLPQPLARHRAPDDLVVVEADPSAGLELAGRRLADVVQQRGPCAARGPGRRPRGRSPARAPAGCARRRPCAGRARRRPSAAPGSRAATTSASPVSTSSSMPARGSGPSSSLLSSTCTRSAVMRASCGAISVIAAHHLGGRHACRAWRRTAPPAASAAGRRRRTPRASPACAART